MSGWDIFWLIIGIMVVVGTFRIFINKPKTFGEGFLEFLCLDVIVEVLGAILENIDFD